MVATEERPAKWPSNYGTKTLIDWQFSAAAGAEIPPYSGHALKRSGPQGHVQPFTVVEDPAAWYSKQWAKDKSWIYELTDRDIKELDAAIAGVEAKGLLIKDVTKADFPLPKLSAVLEGIGRQVSHGRGFQLLRGVPVMRYTEEQSILAAWGLGLYWGNHQIQDKLGQLISHVQDNGTNPDGFNTRAYTTASAQPLHNDNADIVGLLCLRQAKIGGLSSWSSQITAHNEMLLRGRQDLVEVLADGQWWLHKEGWNCTGGDLNSYYNHPVISYHDGYLSCSLQGAFYFKSQSNPVVPKITAKEIEALSLYTALSTSPELQMEMYLQPGDIQLLHNVSMCHSRGHFVNGEGADETRHLLRIWVASEDERPLPDVYKWQWGSTEVGNRGGWHVPLGKGTAPHVPLKACPPTFT